MGVASREQTMNTALTLFEVWPRKVALGECWMKPCPGTAFTRRNSRSGSYPWPMVVCEAEALIIARSSTVWDVITDSGNLTVGDSGIAAGHGDLQDREVVSLRISRQGRTLRVRIRQNPPEAMTWTAALPLRLFRAVRTFVLIPQDGHTLLRVTDASFGPLGRWLPPATAEDLDDFVDAVRHRAELLDRTS